MAVQSALRVWRGVIVYALGAARVYKCETLAERFDTAPAGKLLPAFLFDSYRYVPIPHCPALFEPQPESSTV